jgi:hypothetical protein
MPIPDFISNYFRYYFKKFFPNLYQSEKLHKFWFNIAKPSPIKLVLLILIILIFCVIFSGLSDRDPAALVVPVEDLDNIKNTDQF